jgi:peptidoglycan L-alanyl-D-glutamate endopeptidase CwlK
MLTEKMLTKESIARTNENRLSAVAAPLAEKCRLLIRLAAEENFTLMVTQGFRSVAEQNRLYDIGRRGIHGEKIVTNARGGESNHNFGRAVDFAFVVQGKISWNEKLYPNLGRWARAAGLKWGGDWKKFKDLPHVEL